MGKVWVCSAIHGGSAMTIRLSAWLLPAILSAASAVLAAEPVRYGELVRSVPEVLVHYQFEESDGVAIDVSGNQHSATFGGRVEHAESAYSPLGAAIRLGQGDTRESLSWAGTMPSRSSCGSGSTKRRPRGLPHSTLLTCGSPRPFIGICAPRERSSSPSTARGHFP